MTAQGALPWRMSLAMMTVGRHQPDLELVTTTEPKENMTGHRDWNSTSLSRSEGNLDGYVLGFLEYKRWRCDYIMDIERTVFLVDDAEHFDMFELEKQKLAGEKER